MKRNAKIVLLAVIVACTIPFAFFAIAKTGEFYRLFNPYLDTEIAGPTTISSDWLEIVPKQSLKPERQVQYLYIETAQPFAADYSTWGIRFPDGSTIVPEVQLVAEDGSSYDLHASSFSLKDPSHSDVVSGIGFFLQQLPKDKAYRMVRIRSLRPISCSRIYWRCFNQWDLK